MILFKLERRNKMKENKCECCREEGYFDINEDGLCSNCEDYVETYKKALIKIRDDSSMWRISKVSGCDKYQGLPPLCRYIDSVLEEN